jgi:hypothetical protein
MDMRILLMDDYIAYLVIGVLAFVIGTLSGYLTMTWYYHERFAVVATECERTESIVPIINEMDRES